MDYIPQQVVLLPNNWALRKITAQFKRDGEQTESIKVGRLHTLAGLTLGFFGVQHEGENTFLASAVDGATVLLVGLDSVLPPRAAVRAFSIVEDISVLLNLTDGGGGGGGSGLPATADAIVRVGGVPAQREVVVIDRTPAGEWSLAGYGESDADGVLQLDLRATPGGRVYAVALDDFGVQFQPNLSVEAGQRIRPSVFAGVLYQVTEAGVLPATEPEWWPITSEGSRELGTARAEAVRYYRPLAHGPVPVEVL